MDFGRKALLRASRRIDQIGKALRYAAGGTMRLDDLRSEVERYWSAYSTVHAEEAAGFRPWEHEIATRFIRAGDAVLVVGCGGGRDVIPLLDMGCRVTGVEPSRRAVAAARQLFAERGLTADVVQGFVEDVALPGCYDVISFSDFCYALIPESRRRVEVLRKAVRHLAGGGRIVITAFMTQTHRDSRALRMARALGRWSGSDWRLERGDHLSSILEDNRLSWNFSHEFTLHELDGEIAEAGLTIVYRHPHVPAFVLTAKPPCP